MKSIPPAVLSPCRRYRYYLQRTWLVDAPRACFIMLNPSTADESSDDATIRKCIAFAKTWRMGGIDVVNLFALRATDPQTLYIGGWIISAGDAQDMNDKMIYTVAARASTIICAWGKHGALLDRGAAILEGLHLRSFHPKALRLNKDGSPGHPLYIPLATKPFLI